MQEWWYVGRLGLNNVWKQNTLNTNPSVCLLSFLVQVIQRSTLGSRGSVKTMACQPTTTLGWQHLPASCVRPSSDDAACGARISAKRTRDKVQWSETQTSVQAVRCVRVIVLEVYACAHLQYFSCRFQSFFLFSLQIAGARVMISFTWEPA